MPHYSKPGRRAFIIGILGAGTAVALTGCGLDFPGLGNGMPDGDTNARAMTSTFLPWVNALRADHGLPPVSYARVNEQAALDQARRMALVGKMNHITSRNETVAERFKRIGLPLPAAENIAMYQQTPERAFQAWVNSPQHLKNMLGDYAHMGVAVSTSPNSENRPFWSMDLSQ